jgi:hypothetical protein
MSKTGNMVLFFLAATVFNILLMVGFILVFFLALGAIFRSHAGSPLFLVLTFVCFLGSIVLTFLIYGKIMKWAVVKLNLEKHIPQLFKKRK